MKLSDIITESVSIWITKSPSTKEFRVPSPDGKESGAYYTDDKEDAIATAKNFMYKGKNITVKFKSKEHPTVS